MEFPKCNAIMDNGNRCFGHLLPLSGTTMAGTPLVIAMWICSVCKTILK